MLIFSWIVRKKTGYKGILESKLLVKKATETKPLLIKDWKKASSPLNPLISYGIEFFRTALLGTNDTALAGEFINSRIVYFNYQFTNYKYLLVNNDGGSSASRRLF